MAETRQEIEARFRRDNPQVKVLEDGQERILTETEYEAMMAEWAIGEEARQIRQDQKAQFAQTAGWKATLESALTKLNGDLPLTPLEEKLILQALIKDLLQRTT